MARAIFELCVEGENPHECDYAANTGYSGLSGCGNRCGVFAHGAHGGRVWGAHAHGCSPRSARCKNRELMGSEGGGSVPRPAGGVVDGLATGGAGPRNVLYFVPYGGALCDVAAIASKVAWRGRAFRQR